jgi:tetratricopeptide (TPR) repeat protein
MRLPKLTPAQALIMTGHPTEALNYVGDDKYTLAVIYRHLGRFDEAMKILNEIVFKDPKQFAAWNSLGMIDTDLGKFGSALAAFQICNEKIQGLTLNPEAVSQIRINVAYALMRNREFVKAWPFWESARYNYAWSTPLTPWSGQPGRVLVVCEGGYGDQFLFCRWMPKAKQLGELTYYCFEDLIPIMPDYCKPMLPHSKGHRVSDYYPAVDWNQFDFATSIMSLPAICQMKDIDEIPPDPGGWRHNPLPSFMRDGVGICWEAEEVGVQRRLRSISVEELAPLADICKGQWTSLCPGREHPKWISDVALNTWEDTISALTRLNFVVTIDTAVGHLAGALGVPTYMLLPLGSDWKYFTAGDVGNRSPWFPSVKLIRNTDPLSWKPAIEELILALQNDRRI